MWTILKDNDEESIKLMLDEKIDDRAVAIIATAFLDDRLRDVLIHYLHTTKDLQDSFFEGTGPLAAFSARINMGFMLGLYSKTFCEHLHIMRSVRNLFAHSRDPLDFNSEKVSAKLTNLKFLDLFRHPDHKSHYAGGVTDPWMINLTPPAGPVPTTKRGIFIDNVQVCLAWLWELKLTEANLRRAKF